LIFGEICAIITHSFYTEGGKPMQVNYNKLWKMLIDLNMKKYQLRELAHISSNSMAKLGKNEYVSMEVLSKICSCLNCNIGDICEFEKEPGEVSNG
jgi:putative transcriptional regulator